jgi:cytidylate kinase
MPADEATSPPGHGEAIVDSSTLVVAIDGPSGSGKSTVARGVARALNLRYLDTGAIYRALTWAVLAAGVAPDDVEGVLQVAGRFDVRVSTDPDDTAVVANGTDVAAAIRADNVTQAVSAVSAIPEVRTRLVALQRALIGPGGFVVEGRDIGTVVCPDASVKVFLTASPDARAARRSAEASDSKALTAPAVEQVREDLARRDRLDSGRAASPLLQADDALALDSTAMDVDAVVAYVLRVVADRTRVFASAAARDQTVGDPS